MSLPVVQRKSCLIATFRRRSRGHCRLRFGVNKGLSHLPYLQKIGRDINRRIEEMVLPAYNKSQDHARAVIKARKGVFDQKTYRRMLARLHPDAGSDADLFDAFKKAEKVLLSEKESPTNIPTLPKTVEELREHVRKVDAERKAKRAAAREAAKTKEAAS